MTKNNLFLKGENILFKVSQIHIGGESHHYCLKRQPNVKVTPVHFVVLGRGCVSAGCMDTCQETPSGPKCGCYPGYQLSGDSRTCSDVDECALGIYCAQFCQNIPGSFTCSCRFPDFQLRENRMTCKAKGTSGISKLTKLCYTQLWFHDRFYVYTTSCQQVLLKYTKGLGHLN